MAPPKAVENFQTGNGHDAHVSTIYQLLGAIKGGGLIARSISAEVIRSLQVVRDEKLYLALGCSAFDEFLDKHPESPMSYYLFRQREEMLAKEGPLAFQLLNTLRIPPSKRKLLQAGEVNVVDNEVEINGEKFPISNGVEIRKLIVGILDEKADVDRRLEAREKTIERGKKEMDRKKRRIGELEEQLARGGISIEGARHARALVAVLGDMMVLVQETKEIDDPEEQKRFGAIALERLAEAKLQFEETLGFKAPKDELGLSDGEMQELIDAEGD